MPDPPTFSLPITSRHINLVAEISEQLGARGAAAGPAPSPKLRRENRIRTIQASLAIEQNTLGIDQVSAILDGKRVLGTKREIREVENTIVAYDRLGDWSPFRTADLLAAHRALMTGLVPEAGRFRSGGVGIFRGRDLVHMAPPAERVRGLVGELFAWLKREKLHPLLTGAVAHYELEFIHPFADGNGRIGRLWQTLVLSKWKPELAWLPVETVVEARQRDYYAALAASDKQGNSAAFVEFILLAILECLRQADQVDGQVTDQVAKLLVVLRPGEQLSATELMKRLKLSHRPTFRVNYLQSALEAGVIEMTQPESPRSPTQRYRLRN